MGTSSPLLHQLHALLDTTAPAPTVVFVPRLQVGKALETAIARTRPTVGLTCTTVRAYASLLTKSRLREQEKQPLGEQDVTFATEACYALSESQRTAIMVPNAAESDAQHPETTQKASISRVARMLAKTFSTLRLHGITPATYQEADDASAHQAKVDAYRTYTELLEAHNRIDAASIFDQATHLVGAGGLPSCTYTAYALLDSTDLPPKAERFVETLIHASTHPSYRLGGSAPHPQNPKATPTRAACSTVYAEADVPVPWPQRPLAALLEDHRPDDSSVRFIRTVGADEEVRWALRDIQQRDLRHDTIEIAYTAPDPYLGLVEQQMERHGIRVTLSAGQRLRDTQVGRALRGYLDWLAGRQDLAGLVHLMRAGHLTLHRARSDSEDDDPSRFQHDQWVAAWLAERTCPDGAANILKAIELRANEAEKQAERYQSTSRALHKLLHNAPEAGEDITSATLAAHLHEFMQTFGPAPPDKEQQKAMAVEPEITQKPHTRLLAYLNQQKEEEPSREQPLAIAADGIRAYLEHQFGGARSPQPGHIHVVPLHAAGYAGRDHLYVVGMDSEAMAVAPHEDPLFTDAEREELTPAGHRLPRASDRPMYRQWDYEQALGRHGGDARFLMQHLDPAKSEERFPSMLYQRLLAATDTRTEDQVKKDTPSHPLETTHTLRSKSTEHALGTLDLLNYTPDPKIEATESATEWLQAKYPHIAAGREATQKRESSKTTEYDGLLPDPPYPELDFLNPASEEDRITVSPSRLETFAKTPYLYFVKYVLGVRESEEPVLEERGWLDALTKGTILHAAYEHFVQDLGRMPRASDEEALEKALCCALQAQYEKRGEPPSKQIETTIWHQLWADAQIFLRAETARAQPGMAPKHFEWEFGFNSEDAVVLPIGDGTLHLRGSADRIDMVDGELEIWDYKTGKAKDFDPQNGLSNGRWSLQWMLYAWAAEDLLDQPVRRSGYYFATRREMGRRILYVPNDAYQEEARNIISTLADMARHGVFVPSEESLKQNAWRYNLTALVNDRSERKKTMGDKSRPDDRLHLHWG